MIPGIESANRRKRYRQKRRVCDVWCSPHHLQRLDLWPRRVRQFRHHGIARRQKENNNGTRDPETKSWLKPLKMDGWKMIVSFSLGMAYFQGRSVSFGEGMMQRNAFFWSHIAKKIFPYG